MPIHKDLANSELHEAKNIANASTSDAGKILTPSAATAGTSELRYLKDFELNYPLNIDTNVGTTVHVVETLKQSVLSLGTTPGQTSQVVLGTPNNAKIKRVVVRKASSDTGVLQITVSGGSLIDGAPALYLSDQYDCVELVCDGLRWFVLNTNVRSQGWQWIRDGQYTSGSPLNVTGGVRTKLTIDTSLAGQESYRDPRYDLYDEATDRILFTRPGDRLTLRIAVRAKSATANTYFDLETSFPAPTTGTNVTTEILAKGGSVENRFIREYSFFLDDYAISQGYMEMWVTPNNTTQFYGLSLLIGVAQARTLGGNE